ncbi:MAG: 1,4-dihydroxy-2-naphthoate octaprenyltransferase [Halanaerobiaceae bacterium]|nr:1,4-dihydroxy-2-naphthoate octaprenyltransferase [Halanaerobiaceae bacterium]
MAGTDRIQKIKAWCIAIRPHGFVTTTVSTSVGAALAFYQGSFDIKLHILSMIPLILIHTGTNLINDYYDYFIETKCSEPMISPTYKQVKDIISIDDFYRVGVCCFLASVPFGIILSLYRSWLIFLIGTIGALAGFFYTAKPISYKYYGLGGPSIFLWMGVIMVWGIYYIQTGQKSLYPVWGGIPVSFLITGMQHSNELRDYENDRKNGFRTLPVIIGFQKARYYYYFLISSSYLSLALLIIYRLLPSWTALAFITIPFAARRIKTVYNAREQKDLISITHSTASLNAEFGLLLVITLIMSKFI